jgi:tetratricopeptide (TPR) repeat protein
LEQVDTIAPNFIDSLLLKAEVYSQMQKQSLGIQLLETNLEHYSGQDKIEIYLGLADLYDEVEDLNNVYASLLHVLEIDPAHEEALNRLCFYEDILGSHELSILIYLNHLDDNPFIPRMWYNLGNCYRSLGLFEKAKEAFTLSLDIDPSFEYAYRNLADAIIQLKQFEEAIEVLKKCLEIAGDEEIVLESIGDCYYKIKDHPNARAYYIRALRLSDSHAELYAKIGKTLEKEKNFAQAAEYYQKSIGEVNSLEINVKLANAYFELGNFALAASIYGELYDVSLKPEYIYQVFKCEYHDLNKSECESLLEYIKLHIPHPVIDLVLEAYYHFLLKRTKAGFSVLENAIAMDKKTAIKMIRMIDSNFYKSDAMQALVKAK